MNIPDKELCEIVLLCIHVSSGNLQYETIVDIENRISFKVKSLGHMSTYYFDVNEMCFKNGLNLSNIRLNEIFKELIRIKKLELI